MEREKLHYFRITERHIIMSNVHRRGDVARPNYFSLVSWKNITEDFIQTDSKIGSLIKEIKQTKIIKDNNHHTLISFSHTNSTHYKGKQPTP